jgi:hypothetical protein
MRNLKITKILLSLMLMFGLTTSSFAAGGPAKGPKDNRPKIEKKVPGPAHKDVHKKAHHKKEVKVVKVYKEPHHKPHHHHHHDKVVYYSSNNGNDIAAACIGTGLCVALIAAALNS